MLILTGMNSINIKFRVAHVIFFAWSFKMCMNNPKKVSWESYSANPKAILENPKLVIRDGDRYFNWNTCAAVAVGKIFFKKTLPRTEIEKLKETILKCFYAI